MNIGIWNIMETMLKKRSEETWWFLDDASLWSEINVFETVMSVWLGGRERFQEHASRVFITLKGNGSNLCLKAKKHEILLFPFLFCSWNKLGFRIFQMRLTTLVAF